MSTLHAFGATMREILYKDFSNEFMIARLDVETESDLDRERLSTRPKRDRHDRTARKTVRISAVSGRDTNAIGSIYCNLFVTFKPSLHHMRQN